jgi:hypothetical protein
MNAFSYLLFAQDYAQFEVMALDDLRIWSVSEYFSSIGKLFDISKISIASL